MTASRERGKGGVFSLRLHRSLGAGVGTTKRRPRALQGGRELSGLGGKMRPRKGKKRARANCEKRTRGVKLQAMSAHEKKRLEGKRRGNAPVKKSHSDSFRIKPVPVRCKSPHH